MSDSAQLPSAAMMMNIRVADFDTWKAVFDANEASRRTAGFLSHHVNRAEGDTNRLSIYFGVGDVDRIKAYATSDGLKSLMAEAGVVSVPEFRWMTPVREAVVWDRELPSMILSHRVEDFDAWLATYDSAGEMQHAGGIIGQAVNRSMDDPSLVVVYHQAESFDTLRSFLQSDDLRMKLKDSGVISEPEITFHTGGWGKRY